MVVGNRNKSNINSLIIEILIANKPMYLKDFKLPLMAAYMYTVPVIAHMMPHEALVNALKYLGLIFRFSYLIKR